MKHFQEIEELNEDLKAKPKAKLTQKIQNTVIDIAQPIDEPELYQYLIGRNTQLIATIKQALSEWLRTTPDINFISERIRYLLFLRDKAADKDVLRYLTVLSLIRYRYVDDKTSPILNKWLSKESHNRIVSKKLHEIFKNASLSDAFVLMDSIKDNMPLLDLDYFDQIKKDLADLIRLAGKEDKLSIFDQELIDLKKLIASEIWIKSLRDKVLISNIDTALSNISAKLYLEKVERKVVSENSTSLNGTMQGTDQLHTEKEIRSARESYFPLNSIRTTGNRKLLEINNQKQKIPNKTEEKPEAAVKTTVNNRSQKGKNNKSDILSFDKLFPYQRNYIEKIINDLGRLNNNIQRYKEEISSIKRKYDEMISVNKRLEDDLRLFEGDNEELEEKVQLLRDRLQKEKEKYDSEKIEWQMEKSELQSMLDKLDTQKHEIELNLDIATQELKREKMLGHSTLQDSKHRANMEVQSKVDSIKRSVLPIFREVEDFEKIAETLPDRARMLLNIIKKFQNSMKINGIIS